MVVFYLNMELTESLDNLSFLKRMNRCWQDHCRQTVSFNVFHFVFGLVVIVDTLVKK